MNMEDEYRERVDNVRKLLAALITDARDDAQIVAAFRANVAFGAVLRGRLCEVLPEPVVMALAMETGHFFNHEIGMPVVFLLASEADKLAQQEQRSIEPTQPPPKTRGKLNVQ